MRKLKLLIAACALMGASASWALDPGTYYIQNVSNGKWLGPGNNWGTQASVLNHADYWKLAQVESEGTPLEGVFTLESVVSNGGTNYYLNSDGTYCDGGKTNYTFTSVSDNVYTIQIGDNYLTTDGTIVNCTGTDGSSAACQWKLWSEQDMLDGMAAGSISAPFDATYLIKDHNLERNNRDVSAWSITGATEPKTSIGSEGRQRWSIEAYHKAFDVNQTLSNVPNGVYSLRVNGFYRQDGDGALPVFYANDVEATLTDRGTGTENNMQDAAVAFEAGKYLSSPILVEVTNNTLKIGVKSEGASCWVIFKNFNLEYFGSSTTLEDVQIAEMIKQYEAIRDEAESFDFSKPMANAAKEDLQTARETYANPSYELTPLTEAVNALTTAVNNAKASVTAYANLKAVIEKTENAITTTNVYDAAFFNAAKESYENGYYSTAEASDLSGGDRYKTLFTHVLAANWYIGETLATTANSGLYQNSWSTEGDNDGTGMTNPFMEYWVWDDSALAPNTLSTTITELAPNGTYAISMLVRVRQQNNQTKADDDVTLSLNSGEAINMADGTETTGGGFFYKTITATANADNEGKVAVVINVKEGNHISWLAFKNLSYQNLSEIIAEFNKLKGEATTLLDENAVVTGTERTNLSTAVDASPSGMEGYTNAITALQNGIDAFKAAIPNYQAFDAEKKIAEELGLSDIPSPTTGAEALEAVNQLKVNEYNYVTETYTSNVTSILPEWTLTNISGNTTGQHWSGDGSKAYFDRWNGSSITSTVSTTYNLPAGKYAFYGAGRGQAEKSTAKLTLKIGENTKEIPYVMKGDAGFGIDKTGKANFTAGDDTYANDNKGRGWEWRFITFELSEATEVTFSAVSTENNSWASFTDLTLATTSDNTAIIQQMIAEEVKKAENLRDNAANVGTGAFQIPSSAVEALNSAISVASSTSSISDVPSAISALQQAETDFQNAELNAPSSDQLFTISLANGEWASNGVNFNKEAMTYIANDRADHGNYNIKYQADPNTNLAQAFTFTKVEGNNYKLSQIDADGNVRYMCTGVPYGGNASQIRTTINAEDAMQVTIIPTATEGIYNLRNVAANALIGGQDAGVYTVSSHNNFKIQETTKPSIEVNTADAGFGTIMVPFDVTSFPEGVKVYTCTANGTELNLAEADAIEANKPYIIEGSWTAKLTGDAQGAALTYNNSSLTGVYADQKAAADTYVMQNGTAGVGFYKVASGSEPTVGANHAFLTVNNSAREAYLLGEATAIKAIEALTNGKAEIYNAAGARQQRLQKGVNIIKNGDKTVKVMVK